MRAFLLSFVIHGLLAGVLAAYLEYGILPQELATLDLSSVELSLAEQDVPEAAVSPLPAAQAPKPLQPKTTEAPSERELRPQPPEPEPLQQRQPKESPADMTEPPQPSVDETSAPTSSQPADEAPRQARVDAPARQRQVIKPEYPKGARQRGEQGEVTLELDISADGGVDAVRVVASCGYRELDEAAVRAVRGASFVPAKRGETAVSSTARLKLAFRLR